MKSNNVANFRRALGQLLLLCGLIVFSGASAHARLNVVATTPDLAALAQEVGGKQVEITTLTKPTEDPHFVDPRPSFALKLNKADVLIEGGAELETGWLPPLLETARNNRIAPGAPGRIRASDGIAMLEVPGTLDRSRGDIHAAGNPHFLLDPANAAIVASHIADVFKKLDAANASTYDGNLAKFKSALEERLTTWQKQLAPYAGRRVVAYHNIWPYFAKRFGLVIDLFLEPKPGIPPTPSHLAEVMEQMKAGGVKVIIVEPFQNRQTAERVAGPTGAVVVDVTQYPGGVKGTEGGYLHLMDYIVNALAGALSKTAAR